jgi:hypothetical protein
MSELGHSKGGLQRGKAKFRPGIMPDDELHGMIA